MNKIKRFILAVCVFAALFILLNSCSADSSDKFLTGNEQNNSVFLFNAVCEDKDYVYFCAYAVYTEKEGPNIKRINKKDGAVTELNQTGFNLNLYDGYLYFNNRSLYRLNLSDPNAEAELVAEFLPAHIKYTIFGGKIYPLDNYYPIFRMNADGSEVEEAIPIGDYYHIFGVDDKYIYTIFAKDYETETIDGVRTNVFYFSRMDHDGENKEKLFEIYTGEANGLGLYNDFLVISDGYAYYRMWYDEKVEIIKNKLSAGFEREVIYTVPENAIVELKAVTKDGIYLRKYNREDSYEYSLIPNVKLSLDGKTETPIEPIADEEFIPVFVSRCDGKLYYIKDEKIFAFK
jgi:hypothetical protein